MIVAPPTPARNQNASTLCHAFGRWQDQVATFVARVVAQTGVDGVRLDGLGGATIFHERGSD
jgi:hypothetical protein|eukprot:SAG25_NODE_3456_length_1077_cov_4.267894_1_plen_62_part_00